MAMRRRPAQPHRHLGPKMCIDADTDLANRLELALPYTLDTSKSFAKSLIENQRMHGWSAKQRDWAGRLVEQARDEYRRRHGRGTHDVRSATPEPLRVTPAALSRVLALFASAADAKLKKPAIRLMVGGRMANVVPGREGGLALFWRGAVGAGGFLGKVSAVGEVRAREDGRAVCDALNAFADAEGAAKAYARATQSSERPHGDCCFCGLHLTDPRSVSKGYGPICAAKWNLPWGV